MASYKENMVQGIPPRRGKVGPHKVPVGGRSWVTLDMIRLLPSILEFLSLKTLVPYP